MAPLGQRIPIEQVLGQEKKWLDVVRVASVTPKDKDPVFATSTVWLIHNRHIPRMSDHQYHWGNLVLPVHWVKGYFYQSTDYWEYLGLSGYEARYDYCRGKETYQTIPMLGNPRIQWDVIEDEELSAVPRPTPKAIGPQSLRRGGPGSN